jgi:hypothetical protein
MSRYQWVPGTGAAGRYRDMTTGRFVAGAVVRRELDGYLAGSSSVAKSLAEALRGRQVSLADWELAMRRHIKSVNLNAVALERGGWANMRPSDYGRVGQRVRDQYAYLRNFADQIASDRQRMDGTLDRRARMYTEAARTTYHASKHANRLPITEWVRSIRNARDSCEQCRDLDGRWFRFGDPAYALPGQRICLSTCLCYEEYGREGEGGPIVLE